MSVSRLAWTWLLAGMLLILTGCATDSGVNKSQAADANAAVGADYLRKNENDRAAVAFKKALSYEHDNFNANWGMAVVNEREDNAAAARRYYEKALSIKGSPVVYNSYAAFLCKHGDTKAGIENFKKALATRDAFDRAATLSNAGLCLARAGQTQAAAGYFDRALAIDARQKTALTQLAEIAYHAHQYTKARAYIERAESAGSLDADHLLLAAHIETALHDNAAAQSYLARYQSAKQPAVSPSPGQSEPSGQ